MYIPQVDITTTLFGTQFSGMFDMPSHFSLAMAGVACLLGGSNAISAMATVHVFTDRSWLGWYNIPGSFHIAQQLSSLAKPTSLRSNLFNLFFKPDSSKGPRFRGVLSGTAIEETGYLAELLMKECVALEGKQVEGRKTRPVGITIAHLDQAPPTEIPLIIQSSASTIIFAIISIAVSIGACVACAIFKDWVASSLILLGILASGLSSLVFGLGGFIFTHPKPARETPRGDGILGSDENMVVLIGQEDAVNSITRGRIFLQLSSDNHYALVRRCSVLFFIQSIVQLFLIPQASLFGQIMFLVSLGVSALHHSWLSRSGKEKVHRKILLEKVFSDLKLDKFTLGTRTTAVVFILLALQSSNLTLLNELLPNNTGVWKQWKRTILEGLHHPNDQSFQLADKDTGLSEFTREEKILLKQLYQDAEAAYKAHRENTSKLTSNDH